MRDSEEGQAQTVAPHRVPDLVQENAQIWDMELAKSGTRIWPNPGHAIGQIRDKKLAKSGTRNWPNPEQEVGQIWDVEMVQILNMRWANSDTPK